MDYGYKRRGSDKTLFIKMDKKSIIIAQVYVDDIIFSSTLKSHAYQFVDIMKNEFEMSVVGEFNFFLSFQFNKERNEFFLSQAW